jgi:signal transduction histidine kinase
VNSLAASGFLFALTAAHATVGLYGMVSYARRRADLDLLVFGLLNVALVLVDGGLAAAYGGFGEPARGLAASDAGRITAAILLVHFVLRYTNLPHSRPLLVVLHGLAAPLAIAGALGLLGVYDADHLHAARLFGLAFEHADAPTTLLGDLVNGACLVATFVSVLALGRAVARRRRGMLVLGGGILLGATASYDIFRATGAVHGPALGPGGYAIFVHAVMMTLVARFGTLRRKLELQAAALDARSHDLARSYDDLRAAQDELVRKEQLAVVGELAAVIAHEVRNPLAIIANAVATLRRRELPPDDRDTLLGILDEEASRLNRLVGDLLRYARPVNLERQLVSLRDIVERGLALVDGHDEVTVELHEPAPVDRIWGDANLLRQVVENLINNAVQAMSGGGLLTVLLVPMEQEGARGVELQIQDTGEGMDTQVRNRALDPFFTTRPSGTGLGLAIVARIIDAHGGRLRIKSAAGAGTVMHVFLPIATEAPPMRLRSDPPDRGTSSLPPMPRELRKAIGAPPRRS